MVTGADGGRRQGKKEVAGEEEDDDIWNLQILFLYPQKYLEKFINKILLSLDIK